MVWKTPALAARLLSTPGRGPGFCRTTSDVQTAIPIRPRLKQRATDTTTRLPDGSTADGLPVSWTVLMHVVAVEGYTVQEQAWGETTWDAPEDQGDDWALLWRSNDYRWLAKTTFDGLVTAAYWTFAMMTVDSSRDRWAYDMTKSLGDIPVDPIVTFGGDTLYFQTLNVAHVGLKHADAPSAEQRQIAMTEIESLEWEEVAWSREVEIEAHATSTGLAKLQKVGDEDYRVYPAYGKLDPEGNPVEPFQPADHNTVRVKVELAAGIPENMEGTLHLAWYDPDNTLANVPAAPPAKNGHGQRDNADGVELVEAGEPLPGFELTFTTAGVSPNSDWIQKSYLAIPKARYGDNFIVAVHPNKVIVTQYEFRENDAQDLVLMYQENTGQWTELRAKPEDPEKGDLRTSILTIMPSVDIDTDSDNTGTVERSDAEEEIENHPDHLGKRLFINWNDSNKNGIPDKDEMEEDEDEMEEEEKTPKVYDDPDKDLVKAVLDVGLTTYEGLDGYNLVLHYPPHVRIWADARRHPLSGEGAANPLSIGAVPDDTARTHTWTIDLNAWDPAELFPLPVFVEGIAIDAAAVNWTLYAPGPDGQMLDTDAAKFSVEPIVWPSNETEPANLNDPDNMNWALKSSDTWNGFTLEPGWEIDKSLVEIINGQSATIRTRYPEETSPNSNIWKGNNYPARTSIDLGKALGLDQSGPITNYRVEVHFSYEDAPEGRSIAHYVDASNGQKKPGFFANSGVFVDGITEIQIFDTASLNAAFGDGTTVIINGQNTVIKALMGTAEFTDPDNPNKQTGFAVPGPDPQWVSLADHQGNIPDVGLWRAEEVAALITGIAYNEESAWTNWEDQGGVEVFFTSQADLVAKPGSMIIDVYRRGDGKSDVKVTCGGVSYYYEGIQGTGQAKQQGANIKDNVELQSHWGSGVRFTQAKVTAIPENERER